MTMLQTCTCMLTRAARQSVACTEARQLFTSSSSSSSSSSSNSWLAKSPTIVNEYQRSSRTRTIEPQKRPFSTNQKTNYPRKATPFRSAVDEESEAESLYNAYDAEAGQVEEPVASTSNATAGDTSSSSSSSSSTAASQAWYLSESPASPLTSSSSSFTSTRTPKEPPSPPDTLPNYLQPLWNHLYESPFLNQDTINFIDSKAVESNVSMENMDASVTSWVDWVVIASLRKGRERGIRGASDGVKSAMKECLRAFDSQLAEVEDTSADKSGKEEESRSTNAKSMKTRRKKKIPPVMVEGLDVRDPQWCLIDGSKAIVHVMTERARSTWQVEGVASAFAEVQPDVDTQKLEDVLSEDSLDSSKKSDFAPRL